MKNAPVLFIHRNLQSHPFLRRFVAHRVLSKDLSKAFQVPPRVNSNQFSHPNSSAPLHRSPASSHRNRLVSKPGTIPIDTPVSRPHPVARTPRLVPHGLPARRRSSWAGWPPVPPTLWGRDPLLSAGSPFGSCCLIAILNQRTQLFFQ